MDNNITYGFTNKLPTFDFTLSYVDKILPQILMGDMVRPKFEIRLDKPVSDATKQAMLQQLSERYPDVEFEITESSQQ